jgi:hypothetical protein
MEVNMRKMLLQLICVLAAPTALALSSAPVAAGPIGSFASGAESWTGAHNVNLVKFRRYRNYGYYAPRYTPPPVVYYPPPVVYYPPPVVYYPAPVVREYVAPPVVYDDVDVIYDDVDIIYAPAPRAPYYTGW